MDRWKCLSRNQKGLKCGNAMKNSILCHKVLYDFFIATKKQDRCNHKWLKRFFISSIFPKYFIKHTITRYIMLIICVFTHKYTCLQVVGTSDISTDNFCNLNVSNMNNLQNNWLIFPNILQTHLVYRYC